MPKQSNKCGHCRKKLPADGESFLFCNAQCQQAWYDETHVKPAKHALNNVMLWPENDRDEVG